MDITLNPITHCVLIGCAIAILIKLSAGPLEAYWAKIPAAFRPAVAAGIGMLAAFAEALVSGRSTEEAILSVVTTALIPGLHAAKSSVGTST